MRFPKITAWSMAFIGLMVIPNLGWANSSELFNEAVAQAGRLNSGMPTKERLKVFEQVFSNLDRIVAEEPGSKEALLIVSGQSVGSFVPNALRSTYIKELTEYHDKVCEVSPSYTCLAFVSLKKGVDLCRVSKDFHGMEEAYKHFANAVRIFSQGANSSLRALSVSGMRQCASERPTLGAWDRDYFGSKLVQILLEVGDESGARATIERMQTAFFKFEGVLALKAASKETADKAYLDRLEHFIDENLGKEGSVSSTPDAFLAMLRLRSFAATNSSREIDYSYAYDAIQKYRKG